MSKTVKTQASIEPKHKPQFVLLAPFLLAYGLFLVYPFFLPWYLDQAARTGTLPLL